MKNFENFDAKELLEVPLIMHLKYTVLIIIILACSCHKLKNDDHIIISGSVASGSTDSVFIQSIDHRQGYAVNDNGTFQINMEPPAYKFMALDAGQKINLFLQSGDTLNIILNNKPIFKGDRMIINQNINRHSQLFDSASNTINKRMLYNEPFNIFIHVLDSLKNALFVLPDKKSPNDYARLENKRIHFFFYSLIEQYPFQHMLNFRKNKPLTPDDFSDHLPSVKQINNPDLLQLDQFRNYLMTRLDIRAKNQIEQSNTLKHHDHVFTNYQMDIIKNDIVDETIRNYMLKKLMLKHLKEFGTGNHDQILDRFNSLCTSPEIKNLVYKHYLDALKQIPDHFSKVYKEVDGHALRAFIFSKNEKTERKKPAIVFFFGGGWYEGKPEQFFKFCQYFSDTGFVAIAIDYRTKGRHNPHYSSLVF